MKRFLLSLFLSYSLSFFSQINNTKIIEINSINEQINVSENFSYIVTNDEKITEKNLHLYHNQMKPFFDFVKEEKLKFPKKIWLNAAIINNTKDTLDLVFYSSNSQKVDAWIFSENDTIKKTIGYVQEYENRYSKEIFNSFTFEILPNQKKQIILNQNVFNADYIISKLDISTEDNFKNYILDGYRYYHGSRMLLALLCGGIFMLFFYNFFMFIRTKINNNLYYSLYLLFTFICILIEIDRNQYFFFGRIILFYDLIKVISYTLCIVFYCLFIYTILAKTNSYFIKLFKYFILLSIIYLIYTIISYLYFFYSFSALSKSTITLYNSISFVFILFAIFQMYKNIKIPYIKYIFIGSLVLVFSYLLQAFLEAYGRQFLDYRIFIKTNLSILIGTLFQILLFNYALFLKTSQLVKEKFLSENLNIIKSRFFANISHEFRTPITLIKSPLQSLQSEITNESQKNKLNLIDSNSTRMLELVDQLLELSKIDSGNLKLILKDGNCSFFIKTIVEPFEFLAKENDINFSVSIQKNAKNHLFDKDIIEKIISNLISNAFKYTPKNELIKFTSSLIDSNLELQISNSGSDIKREELSKLFQRFYQKNEDKPGVGIGLALVKELVDLYKGTIKVTLKDSELSFIVNLPLSQINENAIVIATKNDTEKVQISTIENTELPLLLIVDDNAEIRLVLKYIFEENYQILEAKDGEEALKIAQKEIPDCIISDVMMPYLDGFEFTKQIKNNDLTSFIPIILLTAKKSDEAHLEGLKSTADAFITKPFNNEIVKATVSQIIAERKKLHNRYSQELVLRPVDIVINSQEEKFIQKLQLILDKNMVNSEFTTEDFASEIGMSRMQLHRKLKSIFGVSSTEFLRNERLKIAAELLKNENSTISEIAYSVGFNDVSYFSKCFKEIYQCTPTEYIERK